MTDSPSRAARVMAAELAADRWVLLKPPSAVSRFWWRALAVALPVLSLVLLAYSPEGLAARLASQWVVLGTGALMAVAGGIWLWIDAAAPREITTEVNRLLPARPWRECRRLERALRRGEPITGTDRPAADTAMYPPAAARPAAYHHRLHGGRRRGQTPPGSRPGSFRCSPRRSRS